MGWLAPSGVEPSEECSMYPKALSLFPAVGLLGGAASVTFFYAFTWLGCVYSGFGRDCDRATAFRFWLRLHLTFWSMIAQAAAAGAIGGLAVGSACPPRWSGPMVGVLAVVVGLVATAAGVVGMLGEILVQKYRPFNNLFFQGILASLLAIAGLVWCGGSVSR
jgi:hypothetical protein